MLLLIVEHDVAELNRSGVHRYGVIQVVSATRKGDGQCTVFGFHLGGNPHFVILAEHVHYPAAIAADISDDALRPVVDERERDGVGIDGDPPVPAGSDNLAIYMRHQTLRRGIDIAVYQDVFRLFVKCHLRVRRAERHIVHARGVQSNIRFKNRLIK